MSSGSVNSELVSTPAAHVWSQMSLEFSAMEVVAAS